MYVDIVFGVVPYHGKQDVYDLELAVVLCLVVMDTPGQQPLVIIAYDIIVHYCAYCAAGYH